MGAILVPLLGVLGGFLERWQRVGAAKTDALIERAKAGATGLTGRIIVCFWFYPAFAAYVPWLREDSALGFRLLSAAPEWYLAILATITMAVLGIEKWQGIRR